MSYTEKLKESKEKVYNFAIATKILDLMEKLRMDPSNESERRWVWELLQNAKDVGFEDGVSVEINLNTADSEPFVEFSHNGKSFSVDNITFLIEQVSTKERKPKDGERPKTTGKFGTGFLTTHLLSEKVELQGVVKEADLPHRKFSLLLDRSGREIEEITTSVNNSIAVLESLDIHTPFLDYNSADQNTKFRYKLDSKGLVVANLGVKDLHNAIPFTLIFNKSIKSVNILNESVIYKLEGIYNLSEEIKLARIIKSINGINNFVELVFLSEGETIIAIEVERRNEGLWIKDLGSRVPRLFCDFPLIGSENFNFPVVVNSPLFNPNEPRSGVWLNDKDEQKVLDNKAVMREALYLFAKLLNFASANGWQDIYLLAHSELPEEKDWISKKWFQEEIQKTLRDKILTASIVDTVKYGRIPIKCGGYGGLEEGTTVGFPYHPRGDAEHRRTVQEKIWDLCNFGGYFILPLKKDISNWQKVIWGTEYDLTIEEVVKWVSDQKNISSLSLGLKRSKEQALEWLSKLFQIINLDEVNLALIAQDKYAIIPNQNGDFQIKSLLSVDSHIDEELKEVLNKLGKDWRDRLVNKFLENDLQISLPSLSQENIIEEINKVIKEGVHTGIGAACAHLICCFSQNSGFPDSRTKIYDFTKALYKGVIGEKRMLQSYSPNIWQEADKIVVKGWLVQKVADQKSVLGTSTLLGFEDQELTLNWLNELVSFLVKEGYDHLLNLKTAPILPDQNGVFKVKDDLFLDSGDIDEPLKDIAVSLGFNCRAELLDKRIYLVLSPNRVRSKGQIAEEIAKLIKPYFAEFPRSLNTKQIFKSLFIWFNRNKEITEEIFEDLYKNKHRLYDDDEIAENMQKAEMLDEFLLSNGMSLEELIGIAQKERLKSTVEAKLEEVASVQDALINLGITSIDQLEAALSDKSISRSFSHISEASHEMLQYVLSLIERSKRNVRKYLENHPDYDCTNWREASTTVIAGVNKNNKPINIVVRPADGGQVIFYYGSEKTTLEHHSAELWIDDDVQSPQLLTLGRILKRNQIDRINV